MCSDSAPPPPAPTADPKIGEAAMKEADLGQNYLDFAKNQFTVSQGMQADLNNTLKQASDSYLGMAQADRARYEGVFQPLQDQYIQQAENYDSPERLAQAAAQAKTDVASNAALQRGTTERQEQSVGISPASGRFAGIDRAVGLGTALGSVDAENKARQNLRDTAITMRGNAINMGAGLPAQSLTESQAGITTANQPLTNLNASQAIVTPGYSAAITGNNNAATQLNASDKTDASVYGTQADIYGAQLKNDQANAAGIGKLVGTGLGIAAAPFTGGASLALSGAMLSTKKAKENRKPVPEGQSLDAVEQMPIESYDYKPGMGDGGSHVGPMAEDFQKATGRGDGKGIAVQDAIGIAMGAIKDLSGKVDRMAAMIGLGSTGPGGGPGGARAPQPAMA